jgi:hypothetical protein
MSGNPTANKKSQPFIGLAFNVKVEVFLRMEFVIKCPIIGTKKKTKCNYKEVQ